MERGNEIKKETLEQVIGSLFEVAQAERRKAEPYKNMFEASEHGLRGLLDNLNDAMGSLVLDAVQVIEDRTGHHVSHDLYYALGCLPYIRDLIEREISNNEGFTCSVDKAREIVKEYALNEIFNQKSAKTNQP